MVIGIVCTDAHWGIGKNNALLFNLKGDMKFFRETTSGHVVAMGYNTLLSFPEGKPLKNRTNLVLACEGVERDDCVVVHSFDAMLDLIQKYSQIEGTDVYVIGGGMFYKSMLQYYDKVYVTKVAAIDPDAQVFFPDLDAAGFKVESESANFSESGLNYKFVTYVK